MFLLPSMKYAIKLNAPVSFVPIKLTKYSYAFKILAVLSLSF